MNTEDFAQLSHAQINAEEHDSHLPAANGHNEGVCTRLQSDVTNQFQIYTLYRDKSTNIIGMYDVILLLLLYSSAQDVT